MTSVAVVDNKRVAGSLYGLLVGDAVAVAAHWFYSPTKLRADYGEITEMVAPKTTHAQSCRLMDRYGISLLSYLVSHAFFCSSNSCPRNELFGYHGYHARQGSILYW